MPRILFHVVDSVGLGHLSRAVSLAASLQRLAQDSQILFLVESADTRILNTYAIPVIQIPPRKVRTREARWRQMPSDLADGLWVDLVNAAIHRFSPHVVFFDTYIWPEIKAAASKCGARQIAVLRKFSNMREFFSADAETIQNLSLLVIPHDYDEELARWASLAEVPVYFSGTILRRSRSDIDISRIRQKYGLDPLMNIIVASNGGGNALAPDEPFEQVIVQAARRLVERGIDLRLVLVVGPLRASRQDELACPGPWATITEYEENLIDLFAAANVVVCRGGYNTIGEVEHLGVPTIAIPSARELDDQAARVLEAAGRSPVTNCNLDVAAVETELIRILSGPKWTFDPPMHDEALERKIALANRLLGIIASTE